MLYDMTAKALPCRLNITPFSESGNALITNHNAQITIRKPQTPFHNSQVTNHKPETNKTFVHAKSVRSFTMSVAVTNAQQDL
jgi:hypothetical protein